MQIYNHKKNLINNLMYFFDNNSVKINTNDKVRKNP